MNFLSTTFKYFNLLGGFAAIGALLAMAFLLLDVEGKVSTSAEKLRNFLKVSVCHLVYWCYWFNSFHSGADIRHSIIWRTRSHDN